MNRLHRSSPIQLNEQTEDRDHDSTVSPTVMYAAAPDPVPTKRLRTRRLFLDGVRGTKQRSDRHMHMSARRLDPDM